MIHSVVDLYITLVHFYNIYIRFIIKFCSFGKENLPLERQKVIFSNGESEREFSFLS